jgi:hypothetical protein
MVNDMIDDTDEAMIERERRARFIHETREANARERITLQEDIAARAALPAPAPYCRSLDEMPARERGLDLDTMPIAVAADATALPEHITEVIGAVIAAERARQREVLAHLVAEIRREGKRALDDLREIGAEREQQMAEINAERAGQIADLLGQVRQLRIDLADTRAEIERLRRPATTAGPTDLRVVH